MAPLSMGFFRQEYWRGLPFPPSGGLPDPGIKPASPGSSALKQILYPLSHWGSPEFECCLLYLASYICCSIYSEEMCLLFK